MRDKEKRVLLALPPPKHTCPCLASPKAHMSLPCAASPVVQLVFPTAPPASVMPMPPPSMPKILPPMPLCPPAASPSTSTSLRPPAARAASPSTPSKRHDEIEAEILEDVPALKPTDEEKMSFDSLSEDDLKFIRTVCHLESHTDTALELYAVTKILANAEKVVEVLMRYLPYMSKRIRLNLEVMCRVIQNPAKRRKYFPK